MCKDGTSILQRHGLEPVMATTAILKEKERNKTEKSWQHLGFIPDLEQKSCAAKARERSTAKGKGRSCRNYQPVQRLFSVHFNICRKKVLLDI